uniref:Glutathione S-transferase kappa n=1 Tax=Geotrypetes seraphini TaxID=260995 RepID=A0A6P8NXZ3_GEOSA|nr:glutathione S-transferase kappa 1 isoform X1 [Geotrypetes seraphini]
MAGGGGRKVVELFFDVLSPYTWLGFEVLCRYRSIWNIDVKLRPGFLSGIIHATGNQAPAMVPKKGAYMVHDLQRLATYYQVPLKQPSDFFEVVLNKGSLSAMRFVTAIDMAHPEFVESVSRELWKRIWSTDEDITQPESLLSAAQKAGLPSEEAQKMLKMISSPEVKNRLRDSTEEALNYGAFGMPAIVAHVKGTPHLFFGCDRFELLAHLLGEKWLGPLPPVKAKSHM